MSMIMSLRYTPVQIFISIRSAGASSQIREMLRFIVIFSPGWLVYFFFSGTHPARTRGQIFTVYGSYDVFRPRTVLLGVVTISEFTWG